MPICLLAAEDWSNPSVVMEAFEARSLRMSVACAKSLSKFSNMEEGDAPPCCRPDTISLFFF